MENHKFPAEVTLCLSGGAARGAYHLGVISVLQEHNIEIKAVSGTSIGALIGAALGCGKNANEIFSIMKSKEFRSVFSFSLGKGYFFALNHQAEIINKLIDKENFEELLFPLSLCVCDVADESVLYRNSGANMKEWVLASCSIAPLFKPININGKIFIDGGIVDNFPLEQLQKYDYPIIGINLHPKDKQIPKSLIGWLKKITHTAWQSNYYKKSTKCDIYLANEALNKVKIFSFKDLDKAYLLGVEDMNRLFKRS
ncbi:patatin-like phospholipase family protein [Sulfurimonas sp.]